MDPAHHAHYPNTWGCMKLSLIRRAYSSHLHTVCAAIVCPGDSPLGDNSTFQDAGCQAPSCQDYLIGTLESLTLANGSAFSNARWEIDYVRVYANQCAARKDISGAVSLVSNVQWVIAMALGITIIMAVGLSSEL